MFNAMGKLFKINNIFAGIIAGIILAMASYFLIDILKSSITQLPYWLEEKKTGYFLALIPDLILFRIYMVNLKLDKTGKGFLIVTFIGIIAVFFLA